LNQQYTIFVKRGHTLHFLRHEMWEHKKRMSLFYNSKVRIW